MIAKSAKIRKFEQRIEQFRQNRLFELDQNRKYTKFNRGRERSSDVQNAELLKGLKAYLENEHRLQERVIINTEG